MKCSIRIKHKNKRSNGQMDGLLNQGCLEIKNDCAIRHILGKSGDQRQLLPLDKVTHIRRELKAALAQLLAWRRRLHHGCRVLFTTEWSWQSEGINYGVNFPIPWGRGKWDMIQGRQLMVPRRPSASSPSCPTPSEGTTTRGPFIFMEAPQQRLCWLA